jgi:hypothetical protein
MLAAIYALPCAGRSMACPCIAFPAGSADGYLRTLRRLTTGWSEQGRLGMGDRLRGMGFKGEWQQIRHPSLSIYHCFYAGGGNWAG